MLSLYVHNARMLRDFKMDSVKDIKNFDKLPKTVREAILHVEKKMQEHIYKRDIHVY